MALSTRIIYLHGFNSSPQSTKARHLAEVLAARGEGDRYACPELPPMPLEAIAVAEAEIAAAGGGAAVTLVGSSLGGFYATWLAEKHCCRAVLVNPAVLPHVGLRAYLGPQQNLYTGKAYQLTEEHLLQWERLYCASPTPSRYLLMLETGDEVLDYRIAQQHYTGAQHLVVDGGDHAFRSFSQHVPQILRFAGRAVQGFVEKGGHSPP